MSDPVINNVRAIREYWARTVTSVMWNQWLMLDTGLRAAQMALALAVAGSAARAGSPGRFPQRAGQPAAAGDEELLHRAEERARQGLAPPRVIYQSPYRTRIDWSRFPDWARPSDPELFEGCSHEG
jgi:hypothetical protein